MRPQLVDEEFDAPCPVPADFLERFREFAALDRRRTTVGVTPLEFQRWRDLKVRLGQGFGQRGVANSAKTLPTLLRIEFETVQDFADAQFEGLARGDGLFINTPFGMPIGRSFVARIAIATTGEELDIPCAVVSSNLANDHTTTTKGMGIRFTDVSQDQKANLQALRAMAVLGEDAS